MNIPFVETDAMSEDLNACIVGLGFVAWSAVHGTDVVSTRCSVVSSQSFGSDVAS